ncbi:MAG TPA: alpha/beta fold hydrolase [Leptolyngbyaceae cyanobacterium M33_DOE_097]|uniref:Alpha/beta fold hydrolase n=1 Tax=Oscillatoriales cyanobacterium SpSt-418 TaxID=2282169 RepID=A0A7C3KDD0_9CYAN|nr:alpha/beta fold hydrolase [Leptolyngbyaceae cyanobacterium M33_DOE_097]
MSIRKRAWKQWRPFVQRFAIGYGLVCLLLYTQQQRLIFFPTRQLERTPSLYGLKYQDVWLTASQKERLHGWWIPAKQPDAPVMLYFHHNAINIGANVSQALQFHKLGYSIFLFDYRGFGQSEGAFPTESQVYEDAQAAWNYLVQERRIPPNQIIIYGHSVGGAIAIDLAAKHPEAGALVVQSSFTSMRDMTKRFGLYWLFPVEFLLRQHFESLEKMKSVRMPVLIITGTEDLQIPVAMGERLYEAAPEFKQLIVVQGGGHDNHLSKQYKRRFNQFVEQVMH